MELYAPDGVLWLRIFPTAVGTKDVREDTIEHSLRAPYPSNSPSLRLCRSELIGHSRDHLRGLHTRIKSGAGGAEANQETFRSPEDLMVSGRLQFEMLHRR